MLAVQFTCKVVRYEVLTGNADYCGFALARVGQTIEGRLQHAFVEVYLPKWMEKQLKWLQDNKVEYAAIVGSKIFYPAKWDHEGTRVLFAVHATDVSRF